MVTLRNVLPAAAKLQSESSNGYERARLQSCQVQLICVDFLLMRNRLYMSCMSQVKIALASGRSDISLLISRIVRRNPSGRVRPPWSTYSIAWVSAVFYVSVVNFRHG